MTTGVAGALFIGGRSRETRCRLARSGRRRVTKQNKNRAEPVTEIGAAWATIKRSCRERACDGRTKIAAPNGEAGTSRRGPERSACTLLGSYNGGKEMARLLRRWWRGGKLR